MHTNTRVIAYFFVPIFFVTCLALSTILFWVPKISLKLSKKLYLGLLATEEFVWDVSFPCNFFINNFTFAINILSF